MYSPCQILAYYNMTQLLDQWWTSLESGDVVSMAISYKMAAIFLWIRHFNLILCKLQGWNLKTNHTTFIYRIYNATSHTINIHVSDDVLVQILFDTVEWSFKKIHHKSFQNPEPKLGAPNLLSALEISLMPHIASCTWSAPVIRESSSLMTIQSGSGNDQDY